MGMKKKMKFGRAVDPGLQDAAGRQEGLRGTVADPFRWAKVRRVERAMIPEYTKAVDTLVARLNAANLAEAAAIAALPDQVRGYEHIKLARAETYRPSSPLRLNVVTSDRAFRDLR